MEIYSNSMGRKYWEADNKGKKSKNPHKAKETETTTIEITKEVRDYLKNFRGKNYTERIGTLDWKQNCAKAGKDGCGNKADGALRLYLGEDLFVAIPLCDKHFEKVEVKNGEKAYEQ